MGLPRSAVRRRQFRLTVTAPTVFSLINNPAETCAFLTRLGEVFRSRRDVYVDLSDVTELTSDAVVVLLSKLIDPRFVNGMGFRGNEPKAETPRKRLHQAGFFEFVRSAQLKDPPEDGRIKRKTSTVVESEVADELIAFATTRMTGERENRRAAYLALVECMANTHEHSSKEKEGVHQWWANVFCSSKNKRSFFTIVDNGVGIFHSVTIRKFRRRVQESLGQSGNAQLLRDWLEGRIELPSRTRQHNRGKGLRAIYDRFKAGGISNLIIIANDVYAHLSDDRYEVLNEPFHGTFVYWELEA